MMSNIDCSFPQRQNRHVYKRENMNVLFNDCNHIIKPNYAIKSTKYIIVLNLFL